MRDEPRHFKPAIGCVGKVAFPDFVEAEKGAKRTNRHRDAARVGPYRCVICHYWHVGSHEWGPEDAKKTRKQAKSHDDSLFNNLDT